MTQDEIRAVVKITIDELTRRKVLNLESYQSKLRAVEVNLYRYFEGKSNDVEEVFKLLCYDPYLDVIYLQYRDNKTLEWIANYLHKDVSTIKRNKKRLILDIYEFMTIKEENDDN